jgi:Na+-translocating ferredoxin:NAD+ oxidoreductase RnfD subunit
MVLTRARRIDTALTFALAWTVLIMLRIWWLNDPLSIALHQLNNGAVMLFCRFMITDHRSTHHAKHPTGQD